jgi:drug/metabolite transporter (DMT)-like permease
MLDTARVTGTERRAWIAWTIVCVLWGTTYLFIKIALETIPPFLMGGLRYASAGVILAAVLTVQGRTLPPRSEWGGLAILGCFLFLFGNGGVVWSEQHVPSGLAAVLVGTSPFWMVGIDTVITRGQRHVREWIGMVVGFAGIVLLVWPDITAGGATGRGFASGVIALQIACIGFSIGSAYTRRHVMPRDVLGAAALQMLFGGLFMLATGTMLGEWQRLSFTPRTAWSLAYLTLAGSLVAFAAFSYALRHLSVAIVSLYTYVNPVIAVALGTLLLGEPFHVGMLLAAAVIAAGILIVGPMKQSPTSEHRA